MTRKPIVAGQFYPANKNELLKQIKDSFNSEFGPGNASQGKIEKVKAVISPHAGYFFSGAGAAHGFKRIKESGLPDVFVIIGLSHNIPKSGISLEDWETPLGVIENDDELGEIIIRNTGLEQDEHLHMMEHSLEVQVPFIQFISKNAKLVPIIASEDLDYYKLGEGIKKSIEEYGKDVVIIASSDFTHYGANYGFVPFSGNVKENMEKLDKGAIEFILKKDVKGFLKYVEKTGATICGRWPIAVLLSAIECDKVELLEYYTSGDVLGEYDSAVGYASIVFY
ncbi:MAG: AmmeMemoRadiSam system protein B [Candidatus Woesearchaeota archaeon]